MDITLHLTTDSTGLFIYGLLIGATIGWLVSRMGP